MSSMEIDCVTEPKTEKLSFLWVIKDIHLFSQQMTDGIYSSPFPSEQEGGDKWYLKIRQRTFDMNEQYLSLFLFYTGAYDVLAEAVFCVIDAADEEQNAKRTSLKPFSRHRGGWGFDKFIPRSALECTSCHSLREGDLAIRCVVTVIDGYVSTPESRRSGSAIVLQSRLSEDLHWLHDSASHSDITIKVGGGAYRVHKAILASRSPVFRAMLSHQMLEAQEKEVVVSDIDYDVFGELLFFIYTGRTRKLRDMADSLLVASDKYGLRTLQDLCERALIESMDVDNATSTLILADRHNAGVLRRSAIDFICAHGSEVTETAGWNALMMYHADLAADVVRELCARCNNSGMPPAKRRRTV
ncbi:speckle-type POZ protein B-like [Amblyomma americanum]